MSDLLAIADTEQLYEISTGLKLKFKLLCGASFTNIEAEFIISEISKNKFDSKSLRGYRLIVQDLVFERISKARRYKQNEDD